TTLLHCRNCWRLHSHHYGEKWLVDTQHIANHLRCSEPRGFRKHSVLTQPSVPTDSIALGGRGLLCTRASLGVLLQPVIVPRHQRKLPLLRVKPRRDELDNNQGWNHHRPDFRGDKQHACFPCP